IAFEKDARHFLYREYLRILREFSPPVFVMENVKGLLSSQINGEPMFRKILSDLSRSTTFSHGYNIYPFIQNEASKKTKPSDFVIAAEKHGIPQKRHRVLLLGIRRDLPQEHDELYVANYTPTVWDAIQDLPPLRSRLSREADSTDN